jgi:hypothetical protein
VREASQGHLEDLDNAGIPEIDLAKLRPYRAATVLQFDQEDLRSAVQSLRRFVRGVPAGRESQYVVVGLNWEDSEESSFDEIADFDDIDVIVYRSSAPPAWSIKDAAFVDTNHILNIALFRRGLVAVHLAEPWKSAIQQWLDRSPRPPLRRVSTDVLEHSFLRGEAKGLWLRGTHSRRATRPDAKNYTGLSLANALDPIEDSSYAMGSGRAAVSDGANPALRGTMGTTPRKSTVWSGRASDFPEYVTFCRGLLDEVEQTIEGDDFSESIFPELAEEIPSLDGVFGAYEVLFQWPDGAPGDTSDAETAEIVDLLDRTEIEVIGKEDAANFDANVTFPEEQSPVFAEVEVRSVDPGFDLDCVIHRSGRHRTTGILRDCFKDTDIVSVYFESGHTVTNGRLYKFEVKPARFKNWIFHDFSGFDTSMEKPKVPGDAMYDAIGAQGDPSLFSWVVKNYSDGYLTCDDGAGEVADFIYVSADLDQLSLIHVKAAQSNRKTRTVSAQAYEVVASQAAKNLVFLNHEVLKERLRRQATHSRPSWMKGKRVANRSEFVESLNNLKANAETAVHIVQPHMQKSVYEGCRDRQGSGSDVLRLRLLETLLNNVRSSAVSYSSDVYVIGESH